MALSALSSRRRAGVAAAAPATRLQRGRGRGGDVRRGVGGSTKKARWPEGQQAPLDGGGRRCSGAAEPQRWQALVFSPRLLARSLKRRSRCRSTRRLTSRPAGGGAFGGAPWCQRLRAAVQEGCFGASCFSTVDNAARRRRRLPSARAVVPTLGLSPWRPHIHLNSSAFTAAAPHSWLPQTGCLRQAAPTSGSSPHALRPPPAPRRGTPPAAPRWPSQTPGRTALQPRWGQGSLQANWQLRVRQMRSASRCAPAGQRRHLPSSAAFPTCARLDAVAPAQRRHVVTHRLVQAVDGVHVDACGAVRCSFVHSLQVAARAVVHLSWGRRQQGRFKLQVPNRSPQPSPAALCS